MTRPHLRLAALSIGQVVSWGVLYYAVIVAAPVIAEETGWDLVVITALFSAGLIVSAIGGIAVGRLLDSRGPRVIMTAGSAVAVAGFAVVAIAPNPIVFGLGWIVVGLAQSAVLYQAAFTVITRRYGDKRHTPMTILTLAGGLASTIFAPIVAGLLTVTDWRTAFLILAAVVAVTTIPIHWLSLERTWTPHPPAAVEERRHTLGEVLRTRQFWFLEATMIAVVTALYAVTLTAIPLLTEKGISYQLAALAVGLIGAGQVIGRLLFIALPKATAPWAPTTITAGLSAMLLAALALAPGPVWLLILLGILIGAVRGAQTLIQASAVADRWGTRNYGSINGAFAAPITITAALTPAIGAAAAVGLGSYSVMALVMGCLALAAVGLARAT